MDKVDRIADWKVFNEHMTKYLERPVKKYGQEMDLMAVTPKSVCVWNILKYAFRLWYLHGKEHDFEKIAHYAQMARTMHERERKQSYEEYKE